MKPTKNESYWADRQERASAAIADRTAADLEKALTKLYNNAMKQVIADFEATYDKLLATIEAGRDPTPADLYKLDRYWQMQAQLKHKLTELGDKQAEALSKAFEDEWHEVYDTIALPTEEAFATIAAENAPVAIDSIWAPDGKTFKQRIWGNIDKLAETLNEELVHCVVTGKPNRVLAEKLQKRFDVSHRQAKTLVHTEVVAIETEAAARRYKDYGFEEYVYKTSPSEGRCSVCKRLDKKRISYAERRTGYNAPPMHPNCKCQIMPAFNDEVREKLDKLYDETQAKKEIQAKIRKRQRDIRALEKEMTEQRKKGNLDAVAVRRDKIMRLEAELLELRAELDKLNNK
jgi:SPP1 gp7 family putative phage head morphogenesis protein